jgi:hypothetical protein
LLTTNLGDTAIMDIRTLQLDVGDMGGGDD